MFIQLRYTLGFLLLFFVSTIWAEVAVPPLSHRVTDLTAMLTSEQNTALENKLAAFEAKKGSQIAVLILPTTQPETIEAFGIRVFDSWKIGRKNIDDGVILIVAKDDRKMRIEVGRGLEGAIPDAIAKRVLAEIIKPYFKNNNYAGGIDAGVNQVIKLIEGEPLPVVTLKNNADTLQNNNFVDSSLVEPGLVALAILIGIDFMLFWTNGGIPFLATILGLMSAASIVFFTRDPIVAICSGFVIYLCICIFNMERGSGSNSRSRNNRGRNSRYSNYWGNINSSNSWSSSSSSDSSSSSSSDFSGGGGESSGGGASDSW